MKGTREGKKKLQRMCAEELQVTVHLHNTVGRAGDHRGAPRQVTVRG